MDIYQSQVTYPSELKRWSIVFPAECLIKHANQTGGDYYACVQLSVEPYNGPENVVFVNAVSYEDYDKDEACPLGFECFNACVDGVRQGIETFLHEKVEAGRPIARLLITLAYIGTHPVDSSSRAFKEAAILCMNECFAKGGLIRID